MTRRRWLAATLDATSTGAAALDCPLPWQRRNRPARAIGRPA